MKEINDYLLSKINDRVFPGIQYSVKNKDSFYCGHLGNKQTIPSFIPNNIYTLYDIASLTKVLVTVTVISRLIDRNEIKLNDSVQKYLPNFKCNDVTIYQLLTHTSGLPADLSSKEIISKEEIINKIYSLDKVYDTGSKVLYSDIGFMLLGFIIEKIYNKSLDIVAKEEVFIPLEMHNTCYNPINKIECAPTEVTSQRGMVEGIVHDEKCCSMGGVSGHAGVFTNIFDLNNFTEMILNDGEFNGKKYLSKEIIDLWFEPLVYEEDKKRYRSLCWCVGKNPNVTNRDGNIISFSGFTGPSIHIDRDNGVYINILTNRIHPNRNNAKLLSERAKIMDYIYSVLKIDKIKNKED